MALEVNDILINIRQFMINGFDPCLKEYQNNNKKMNLLGESRNRVKI